MAGERRTVTAGPAVYGGHVMARTEEEGVLFVRFALPEETVTVRLLERKRGYAFAEAVEILSPSPHRVPPACEMFGACGGCSLQHARYPYQLEMKGSILREAFRRIGKMDVSPETAPTGKPFGYRFRGRFRAEGDRVGFFGHRCRRLVPVRRCPLMVETINAALPILRHLGRRRGPWEFQLASDGTRASAWFPGVPFTRDAVEHLGGGSDGVFSGAVFSDRTWGEEGLELPLHGISYVVTPRFFFQANWAANAAMVRRISDLLEDRPRGRLLDLYAGAGNFSLPLATRVGEIVAVEGDRAAYDGLCRNIARNGIGNVRSVRSGVERYRVHGPFEALVLDPPRAGLSAQAHSRVREAAAGTVFYVSCDPSTLARDVRSLSDRYDLSRLEFHDFFPNTHHVEALAVLSAR